MQIISHLATKTVSYELLIEGKKYYYKEYLDERGKLLDQELSDDDNNTIYDRELMNYIEEIIYL